MSAFLGATAPNALYAGAVSISTVYVGSTVVWSSGPVVWPTIYSDTFTGTNGAAPAAAWKKTTVYPAAGTATIQSNAMRISTNSTAAWSGAGSIFLGDPDHPEGVSATGIPAIASNAEYTFDYTLLNLSQQYPSIAIRARSAEAWSSGDGQNVIKTGYSLVLGPSGNAIDLVQGYNTATITSIPYTFTTNAMKFRIKVDRKVLSLKIWAASGSEPTAWTYSAPVLTDESDGSIAFVVANGPAAEAKTVTIDNFTATSPTLSLGTTQAAPTTEKSGFVRQYTENFDTVAPAGTGTSSFLNVYSTRVQPYDEVAPNYQQRALLSAHDGVMDVGMNGTQGAAWVWGDAATANSWIGGRFAMRAKAIGAFNNGPAIMIWPSNNAWVEGEIDFPESVSGPGGFQGFQDSPWIHHHTMNTATPDDQSAAQDVALGVSWRDWHVYSAEWFPPGKGPAPTTGMVIYYVDEVEVYRTTTDIPKTAHRYMGQVGAYGQPGHMYIDWVTMSSLA